MLLWKQEILWLLDLDRKVSIRKKKTVKINFLKLLLLDFGQHRKVVHGWKKVVHGRSFIKLALWKDKDILLKKD